MSQKEAGPDDIGLVYDMALEAAHRCQHEGKNYIAVFKSQNDFDFRVAATQTRRGVTFVIVQPQAYVMAENLLYSMVSHGWVAFTAGQLDRWFQQYPTGDWQHEGESIATN